MLRSLQSLRKSVIEASDGELGTVEDFLFDDDKWTVRYLVVNTGLWLTGKKVLISPLSITGTYKSTQVIRVSLTREQVAKSPDINTDEPVSRQTEAEYHDYYHWPYYWAGADVWGMSTYPSAMILGSDSIEPPHSLYEPEYRPASGDSHLRSAHTVRGYRIDATDHHFGHVADLLVDERTWSVRYLVIDTINFWPGKSVILSPEWVESISWDNRYFKINLTEEKIKNSPEYNADNPMNREYEQRLYDYYGRPKHAA